MIGRRVAPWAGGWALLAALHATGAAAQQPAPAPDPTVEKLGDNLLRVGTIQVDLAKHQISLAGVVNNVATLEFVANSKGGRKAYESALELDAGAVVFNLALILIGLDKANAVPARRHFDPRPPEGDPVEIWVEWQDVSGARKVRAEDLIYSVQTKDTLPHGPWVYTGSVFLRNGRYLAEVDGTLIGFVHTPAPIIENPLPHGVGRYGSFRLNPNLTLKPGMPVRVTVTALPRAATDERRP